ncbi:hypothetical protein MAUB1S_06350 [Mycolicibacterium aubagnense]
MGGAEILRAVSQNGFVAVEHLQKLKIGNLGRAAHRRISHAVGNSLSPVCHNSQDLAGNALKNQRRPTIQGRRNKDFIENDILILFDFDNARNGYALEARHVFTFEFQAKLQAADINRHDDRTSKICILALIAHGFISHVAGIAAAITNLCPAFLRNRQRQIHQAVLFAFGNFKRRRQIRSTRRIERSSVRHQPRSIRQSDPAGSKQLLVDGQTAHSPREGNQGTACMGNDIFSPSVGLLKMLDAKEHAFAPYDSVVMSHSSTAPCQRAEIDIDDLPARTTKLLLVPRGDTARQLALLMLR